MGTEVRIAELEAVPEAVEILTPRQVAWLTQRHEVTVRRAINNGELRAGRRGHGGRWRIHREDAMAWALADAS